MADSIGWTDEELDKIPLDQLQKMRAGYAPTTGYGKAVASGIEQGMIGAGSAIPSVADFGLRAGAEYLPEPYAKKAAELEKKVEPWTYEPWLKSYEEKHGKLYQPKSVGEGLAQSAGSFLPGIAMTALTSGLGSGGLAGAASNVGKGLLSSAGSEIAGRALAGIPGEGLAHMIGALAGYNAPAAAKNFTGSLSVHTGGAGLGALAAHYLPQLFGQHGGTEKAILGSIVGPEVVNMAKTLWQEPWQSTKAAGQQALMLAGTPVYGQAFSPGPEGVKKKGE
jgi:hypothetical protein